MANQPTPPITYPPRNKAFKKASLIFREMGWINVAPNEVGISKPHLDQPPSWAPIGL